MERCPTCQFAGKSLQKHCDKKPCCEHAWQEQQERKRKAPEDIGPTKDVSDLSVVHSDNNGFIASNQDESHASSLNDESEFIIFLDDVHLQAAEVIDTSELGFTVNQCCETELLKILNDKHVPHGIYQDVLEWSQRSKRMNHSFESTCTKQSTQMRHLT